MASRPTLTGWLTPIESVASPQFIYKLYTGGQHEMFNETNKDEVVTQLVRWLEQQL